MPSIPEHLDALEVLDALSDRTENPIEAPWEESPWATGTGGAGALVEGAGYRVTAGFSEGANNASAYHESQPGNAGEIVAAKVKAHENNSGDERWAGLYLGFPGFGDYSFRLRWVQTGTDTFTVTIQERYGGGETAVAEATGVSMSDGGEMALIMDTTTGIVSAWVKATEGSEWEEIASGEPKTAGSILSLYGIVPGSLRVALEAAGNITRWKDVAVGELETVYYRYDGEKWIGVTRKVRTGGEWVEA